MVSSRSRPWSCPRANGASCMRNGCSVRLLEGGSQKQRRKKGIRRTLERPEDQKRCEVTGGPSQACESPQHPRKGWNKVCICDGIVKFLWVSVWRRFMSPGGRIREADDVRKALQSECGPSRNRCASYHETSRINTRRGRGVDVSCSGTGRLG